MIFDAHFHLAYLPVEGRDLFLSLARKANVVAGLVAGVWLQESQAIREIAGKVTAPCYVIFSKKNYADQAVDVFAHEDKFGLFVAEGLHPFYIHENWLEDSTSAERDIKRLAEIVSTSKDTIWAIGETGFDLSRDVIQFCKARGIEKQRILQLQQQAFEACLDVAKQNDLPLIFHTRDAWQVTMEAIRKARTDGVRVMIHCFGGPAESVKELCKMGVYLSYGGIPTRAAAPKVQAALLQTPIENLLLETDSPDLVPEVDGARLPTPNRPGYLTAIRDEIARLRNEDPVTLAQNANSNLLRFLGLSSVHS